MNFVSGEGDDAAWAEHAHGCEACAARLRSARAIRLAATAPVKINEAQLLARVEARLGRRRPPLGLLAVAAGLGLAVFGGFQMLGTGTVQARGEGESDWRAHVTVEVRRLEAPNVSLANDEVLEAQVPLTLWYRNVETTAPLFMLAYLVDASGELHWLAPTYVAEGVEPPPAMLRAARGEQLWTSSVVVDGPAPGPATLFVVVSRAPASVVQFEAGAKANRLHPERAFSDVLVWSHAVVISH